MADIRIKRAYEPAEAGDGFRVLVDRLWPRGLTKDKARIDLWAKDIAPSTELRQWFHSDRSAWEEFQTRYLTELQGQHAALRAVLAAAGDRTLILLYAAKASDHTHASVLKHVLESMR